MDASRGISTVESGRPCFSNPTSIHKSDGSLALTCVLIVRLHLVCQAIARKYVPGC